MINRRLLLIAIFATLTLVECIQDDDDSVVVFDGEEQEVFFFFFTISF